MNNMYPQQQWYPTISNAANGMYFNPTHTGANQEESLWDNRISMDGDVVIVQEGSEKKLKDTLKDIKKKFDSISDDVGDIKKDIKAVKSDVEDLWDTLHSIKKIVKEIKVKES